ncbi:hypothetical protein [Nonomuraea sp. NPDC050783]
MRARTTITPLVTACGAVLAPASPSVAKEWTYRTGSYNRTVTC